MLPEISFYLSFLLILILPISNFTYAKDVAESSHKMEHGDTKNLEKKCKCNTYLKFKKKTQHFHLFFSISCQFRLNSLNALAIFWSGPGRPKV